MADLCEGGNESPGSLKAIVSSYIQSHVEYAWYASKLINEREVLVNVKDICFAAEVRKNNIIPKLITEWKYAKYSYIVFKSNIVNKDCETEVYNLQAKFTIYKDCKHCETGPRVYDAKIRLLATKLVAQYQESTERCSVVRRENVAKLAAPDHVTCPDLESNPGHLIPRADGDRYSTEYMRTFAAGKLMNFGCKRSPFESCAERTDFNKQPIREVICYSSKKIGLCEYKANIRRMEEQLKEEQFDFRKRKGTRDAIGLLRTIGERYLENNKEVYVVFVDLEKVSIEWIGIN
ncbi:hypothetical protein ANN_09303 [Periplaneta americana]|uniref:Uncharacterized protein n=1 Tax=Periplaneta americana TaxID=6978 RepID=A0ABQ8TLB8_PERAM|nr:hypothetical protein ANN_09303 [Periplaneta americana]